MLTLFHTAPSNVVVFDALLEQIAPDVPARHVVDEAILCEVRDAGAVTPSVIERVRTAMAQIMSHHSIVLCTCSTIGGLAEQTSDRVLRVDRPMAERAVALGSHIAVAATLKSTIEPTKALLLDEARKANRAIRITELLISGAWPIFERGDKNGYAREIARYIEAACANETFDVVVLAQASMAEAERLCAYLPVPVLSSPRLGLEAAIYAYRKLQRQNVSEHEESEE